MAVIVSVFAIVFISMLINRVATIALALTGMSREEARFQARAAMSGVGLTTRSPDDIVAHPVRRRIVLCLMIVGSAGIITGIASLVLSFNGGTAGQRLIRAAVLVGALFGLWLLSRTKPVDRALAKAIGWLAGRSLRELRLRDEGVVVMGIKRGGQYLGAPGPETTLEPKDTLVLYGREQRISELDRRPRGAAGEAAHRSACSQERDQEHQHPPRQHLKTAIGS